MTELRRTTTGMLTIAIATAFMALAPQAAAAQEGVADGWLPMLGCWQPELAPVDAPMTCLRPAAGGAVEVVVVGDAGVVESRTIRADGVQRPTTHGECSAVERAEFSQDGRRVFLEGERTCPGERARATRGLMAMIDEDRWIDAEATVLGGRSVAWVTRYEPAPRSRIDAAGQGDILALVERRSGLIRAARVAAAEPITVDDIIEAHARTDAELARVLVAEQLYTIDLDASGLVRLADAGVPDEVIDVVVALAYPDRFAVVRDEEYSPRTRRPRGPVGVYPGYWDPYYGSWGWGWGRYRFHRPTVIVVAPRDGSTGTARAVRGRGYTRGTSGGSDSGATARTPRTSSKPAASGGGSRSSGTDRRAQPRRSDD